jgi:hypothetical protein
MVKVAFGKYRRRSRRRSPALCGLVAAALLGLDAADHGHALGAHENGSGSGLARSESSWRSAETGHGGFSSSVVIRAAKTWTIHRPAARLASAALVIRCDQAGKLGVHVTFPDRVWDGAAIVEYKLGNGQRRFGERRSKGPSARGMVRLGGGELVRDILQADVMDVVIDDVGLGRSEAVFILKSAKEAVHRIEKACRKGDRPPPAAVSSPDRPAAAISSDRRTRQLGPAERQELLRLDRRRDDLVREHVPDRKRRAEDKDRSSPRVLEEMPQASPQSPKDPPPGQTEPVPPQAERPAVGPEEHSSAAQEPLPAAPGETAAPAPPHQDTAPQPQAASEVEPVLPSAAEPSVPPPPPPAAPSHPDATDRDARLAAYVERYGPNRKGELIYGWYYQCLARAGIGREQVWYLTDPELTYLSRGEKDRVRLSLLVSTARDPDVPPRRVTCYGVARGRDLVIERTE